eukprot:7168110-Prymnesium_polylepis.1
MGLCARARRRREGGGVIGERASSVAARRCDRRRVASGLRASLRVAAPVELACARSRGCGDGLLDSGRRGVKPLLHHRRGGVEGLCGRATRTASPVHARAKRAPTGPRQVARGLQGADARLLNSSAVDVAF